MPGSRPRSAAHIFLSFKTEERDRAQCLKSALNSKGFEVWWQEQIQCGHEWHGEVDVAVGSAGCIVVLWSNLSIRSPWVRHEASQAIVRGVYAPARLEPMAIESPYNRIQATDLIDWDGDVNHPGFLNLVGRIEELMPPPKTALVQTKEWLSRSKALILAAVIAALAFGLLFRMGSLLNEQGALLDGQIRQQKKIASEIDRSLQPLKDVQISAFVDVDPVTPGLSDYVKTLRAKLLTAQGVPKLPFGVYPSRGNARGPEVLGIRQESGLWPREGDTTWLYEVVRYVELSFEFRRGPGNADLQFNVGSYDPDGSEGHNGSDSTIDWEMATDAVSVNFTDTPLQKWWKSNGNVVSVPDLENSTLTVSFRSTMVPRQGNDKTVEEVRKNRGGLRLSTIFLNYSGRKIMIRGKDMKEEVGDGGLRRYSIALNSSGVEKLSGGY